MPKELLDCERNELINWLLEHQVNVEKIHRECSDGVVVANVLKAIYPKLVESHNYQPRSSLKLKIVNWETLNFKVLSKIGLPQKKSLLEEYAKGNVPALEQLFFDIMEMEKQKKTKQRLSSEQPMPKRVQQIHKEDDVIVANVNKIIGDAIVCVPQKMIKYSFYQKACNELKLKEEKLQTVQQQVMDMEELLKDKSNEIDYLCNQLAHQTVASLMEQCKQQNSNQNTSVREKSSV